MKKIGDNRTKAFLVAVEKLHSAGKSLIAIATALGTSETSIRVILSLLPKK